MFLPCGPLPPWEGATLVMPALSIGNVGQLAVDLLVSCRSAKRVGFLEDDAIVPTIGNDAFSPQGTGVLTTSAEVFWDAPRRLALLQFRAPVVKGHFASFASRVVAWVNEMKFSEVVLLASCDTRFRPGAIMPGHEMAFAMTPTLLSSPLERALESLGWERGSVADTDAALVRPHSMAGSFFNECVKSNLSLVVLIAVCPEGENIPDGERMATSVCLFLQATIGDETHVQAHTPPTHWTHPPSWRLFHGTPSDPTLFA